MAAALELPRSRSCCSAVKGPGPQGAKNIAAVARLTSFGWGGISLALLIGLVWLACPLSLLTLPSRLLPVPPACGYRPKGGFVPKIVSWGWCTSVTISSGNLVNQRRTHTIPINEFIKNLIITSSQMYSVLCGSRNSETCSKTNWSSPDISYDGKKKWLSFPLTDL